MYEAGICVCVCFLLFRFCSTVYKHQAFFLFIAFFIVYRLNSHWIAHEVANMENNKQTKITKNNKDTHRNFSHNHFSNQMTDEWFIKFYVYVALLYHTYIDRFLKSKCSEFETCRAHKLSMFHGTDSLIIPGKRWRRGRLCQLNEWEFSFVLLL